MGNYNSRTVGILGAVIVHLIAAIIFMIVKLGELNITEYTREYEVSLEETSQIPEEEVKREVRPGTVEQVLQGDPELLNIARNLANRPDEKIDPEDILNKVKEEMIKNGQLGTDNFIDEQKRLSEQQNIEEEAEDVKIVKEENEEKPREAEELASKYSGPTRIYYSLKGRIHTYLPIPIYKCEGSGKVTLSIEVNPRGLVTNARLIESESTTKDDCLVETAINAALISRFNVESSSLKSQSGTLTYHFVAQD